MTLKEKQLAFLEDTVQHYNANNRSSNSNECSYAPAHEYTLGCAIGRHIEDKELCRNLDLKPESGVSYIPIFNELPQELRDLGIGFLTQLQTLHDREENWDEEGLTDLGSRMAVNIQRQINEGRYDSEQLSA
jgi:hypothetical protein